MSKYKYENIKCKIGWSNSTVFDDKIGNRDGSQPSDCSGLLKQAVTSGPFTLKLDDFFGFNYVESYPNIDDLNKKIGLQYDLVKFDNNVQTGKKTYKIIAIEDERIKIINITDGTVEYKTGFNMVPENKEVSASDTSTRSGGRNKSLSYKQCDDDSLKIGCAGNNVKVIQGYLSGLGYNLGKYGEDGKFGSITKAAIIKLQKDNNLPQTGVVDTKTLQVLESESTSGKTAKEQTPVPDESTSAETIQKEYKIIQNRYNKLENLVFERLVKNAN